MRVELRRIQGSPFHPNFSHQAAQALVLGDLLQTVLLRVRPYETKPHSANALYQYWDQVTREWFQGDGYSPLLEKKIAFKGLVEAIVQTFDALPIRPERDKPRVGIVGEILVKFHPDANNNVIGVVESEGCEAVLPGLLDFFLYSFSNARWNHEQLGTSAKSALVGDTLVRVLELYRRPMVKALQKTSGKFSPPVTIHELGEKARQVLSLGNSSGGAGFDRRNDRADRKRRPQCHLRPAVCLPAQPCDRKGMIKELRRQFKDANIVAIDYDPGASEVNQLNRIKLMISTAFHQHQMPVEVHITDPSSRKIQPKKLAEDQC